MRGPSPEASPGPWEFITIANDYGKVICHEEGIHDTVCVLDYDNAASNGRLIAAAPDLLSALQSFVKQWEACGPNSNFGRYFSNVRDAAVAAITKARLQS